MTVVGQSFPSLLLFFMFFHHININHPSPPLITIFTLDHLQHSSTTINIPRPPSPQLFASQPSHHSHNHRNDDDLDEDEEVKGKCWRLAKISSWS
ncbi:hypothetical protein Droror1_Dr00012702 [Drosera rotundifolia]